MDFQKILSEHPTVTSVPDPPIFPVVGIGASAGGLAAFEAFFAGMPTDSDPGMAFVLVQHLAPDHKSILADLISRYTRMPVFEVEDGMQVRPNCAYILPPNADMAFVNGELQLLEPLAARGLRLPIDFFFRTLAQELHDRAIGVVLSGTGSDGTLGLRAIKGSGGMAMAQSPNSAEYDGMPSSAIATGLVDFVLPPMEMAAQLITYVSRALLRTPQPLVALSPRSEISWKKIFALLRMQSGHDFSLYKPNTIHRRIERRLALHQIESIEQYVRFLQVTPGEVDALFRDLLIGVTQFFRDAEAFQVLGEQVIPAILAGKAIGSPVRVWSAGCSTGEEAYSLAILLAERQAAMNQIFAVQVFATDIDPRAVAFARVGRYPASIAADISPERLSKYFTAETGGDYRIHKSIRDMVIFSEQDLIRDPPFSKLDLISCRNVMIYMASELQKKLIPMFRFALNPGGFLFLGTSETVGESGESFSAVNRAEKLYRCATKQSSLSSRLGSTGFFGTPSAPGAGSEKVRRVPSTSRRELTEQAMLQQFGLAGALVNGAGDLFYLHGRTGMYLEPAAGEVGTANIIKMAREGLERELVIALRGAAATGETVRRWGLRVKANDHFSTVNLSVSPVAGDAAAEAPLFLVLLEPVPVPSVEGGETKENSLPGSPESIDESIYELQNELRAKEAYLELANEELATSNEDLRSSNEEMQSVNEELQSSNEELETSKEELQSVNEELATVNAELQTKVTDLSQANNDMNNLLGGTGIGTVFVDLQLRILRFTPAATTIINLIPGDVGRPVGHVVSNLVGYDRLDEDVQTVLDSLVPQETEVRTKTGQSYSLRILLYRTLENVIEGAVLTFVKITEIVSIREALRKANELARMAVIVRDAHDAITLQDLDGRILAWNPGAVRLYGWSEAEALAMNVRDRIPAERREEALARIRKLSEAEVLEPYRTQRMTKAGAVISVSMVSTALVDEEGRMYGIATTERVGGPVESDPE